MEYYPHTNSPVVLTDAIFLVYGGQTGTSTQAQRQIAYIMAEEQMTEYLSAFLIPTVVTGTYFWRGHNPLELDHGHVLLVKFIGINSADGGSSCEMSKFDGACSAIRNMKYGYLDVWKLMECSGCGAVMGTLPYTVSVSYESGLPTGTSNSPRMLQALTLAAQINLNEIDVSLANESIADIGLKSFTNQRYSEIRMMLSNSAFGNSPVANRIARLVRHLRGKPSIGFH